MHEESKSKNKKIKSNKSNLNNTCLSGGVSAIALRLLNGASSVVNWGVQVNGATFDQGRGLLTSCSSTFWLFLEQKKYFFEDFTKHTQFCFCIAFYVLKVFFKLFNAISNRP
jgi:hypothetical protein